jgi:hypothetical protein
LDSLDQILSGVDAGGLRLCLGLEGTHVNSCSVGWTMVEST